MVLESFGTGLKNTFKKITGLGIVDKEAVEVIIKDLQRVLLQADVDAELVFEISETIKKKMKNAKPGKGLTLKEYFIKTLYDEIVNFIGKKKGEIALKKQRIILIGLFGSGKTTSAARIAKWFKTRGLKTGMVAADTHRAAAQTQLKQLGKKIGVPVYYEGKKPEDIVKKALKAKEDVLIFDTAGRDALDKKLAKELKNLAKIIKPDETLLVLPADIGQAAKKQSEEFNKLVGITGIIITKLDGTAKGGGALAAGRASKANIKFIGTGEKTEDLEQYDPQRFVSKLIGYGDIQGLLEKAKEVGLEDKKIKDILRGEFTLDDFYEQIISMQKMGSLSKITEMIPGFGNLPIKKDLLNIHEDKMKKWKYIIDSLTSKEKKDPTIMNASRIQRVAKGSGTKSEEIREMLKYYKQIKKVMKLTKGGKGLKRGPFAQIARQFGMKV